MNHHQDTEVPIEGEKHANGVPAYDPAYDATKGEHSPYDTEDPIVLAGTNTLHRSLKGRHMQMIAM